MSSVKGDWVEIGRVVLSPSERANGIPEDTDSVPLEMRVRGFLLNNKAETGDSVSIRTTTERVEKGLLLGIRPAYNHGWGRCIMPVLKIGPELRRLLEEKDNG